METADLNSGKQEIGDEKKRHIAEHEAKCSMAGAINEMYISPLFECSVLFNSKIFRKVHLDHEE